MTIAGVVATHRRSLPSYDGTRRGALKAVLGAGACVAVLVLTAGCAGAPKPPPPTQVNGSIQADAGVNPSVSGRPSPLLVRVYELKAATAFNGADFVALFQRDQAELGADVVAREEMMLNPGESRPFVKTLAPETRFIAVFAAYRDLERANWRAVVAIEPGKKNPVLVRAGALAISATMSN